VETRVCGAGAGALWSLEADPLLMGRVERGAPTVV